MPSSGSPEYTAPVTMKGVLWISGGVCRARRERGAADHRRDLVGRGLGPVAEPACTRSPRLPPGGTPRRTPRSDLRVALERERGDHAEVAATAADGPEEIGVRVRRGRPQLTVGAHHLGGHQVVDRHPVLAADPSLSAPEREPGDAGVGDDAVRRDQPEGLGLVVHVADERSALDAHRPGLRVDVDAVHRGQVEQHASVDARESRDRVATPANGDEQPMLAGEVDRGDDVSGAGGAHDQRRLARVHRVVRRPDRLEAGVSGGEHVTPDPHTEFLEARVADRRLGAFQRCCRHCHRTAPSPERVLYPANERRPARDARE